MTGKGLVSWGVLLITVLASFAGAKAHANPHYFELENGVKVVLVQGNTDSVVVLTRFNVGFLDESVKNGETGISHFLEHLLAIRGTETFQSQHLMMEALNALQAQFNASTTHDRTSYFLIGKAEKLSDLIRLQAEQVAKPLFNADSLELRKAALEGMSLEKGAVSEESLRGQVDRDTSAFEIALMAHAESERLRQLATGTAQDIQDYSPQTVREFYQRYYTGPNAVVVVVGGIADLAATKQVIKQSFGALPKQAPPAPGLAKDELRPAHQPSIRVATVKAIGEKTRSLMINYPLRHDVKVEAAAKILARYLNRRGKGSTLNPLFQKGYFGSNGTGIGLVQIRDLTFLHFTADLTVKGERNVAYVKEYLEKVFTEIAANGIPESLTNDIKFSVLASDFDNGNLLQLAERVAGTRASYDVDKMRLPREALEQSSVDDMKALAAKLLEPRAELTIYTSKASGQPNEVVALENYAEKYAETLPRAIEQVSSKPVILDAEANRFMNLDQAVMNANPDQGNTSKILILPRSDNTNAEAVIELGFLNGASAREQLATEVVMTAFVIEPAHERFFSMLREAGVNIEFGFNHENNKMLISIDSTAPVTSQVVRALLTTFRAYVPGVQTVRAAKLRMMDHVRETPVNEVGRQALDLGLTVLAGEEPVSDLKAQIKNIARVDLNAAKRASAVMRQHWSTQATLMGNWDPYVSAEIGKLLQAPHPESLSEDAGSLKKKRRPVPTLAVKKVDVERAGMARLWSLDATPYGKEYWALAVFSELVDRILMETVRGQYKMAYTPLSGLSPLEGGRSVFFVYSDTSKPASSLAMGFSIALEDALHGELTEVAFEAARQKTLSHLGQIAGGAQGVHNKYLHGQDWDEMAKHIVELKREELQSMMEALFRNARPIDAVATNNPNAYCNALLTEGNSTNSVVKNFYQKIAPKLQKLAK